MTSDDQLILSRIDAMLAIQPPGPRVPHATFCGVQAMRFDDGSRMAMLLINFGKDTKTLVWYDSASPVRIVEAA